VAAVADELFVQLNLAQTIEGSELPIGRALRAPRFKRPSSSLHKLWAFGVSKKISSPSLIVAFDPTTTFRSEAPGFFSKSSEARRRPTTWTSSTSGSATCVVTPSTCSCLSPNSFNTTRRCVRSGNLKQSKVALRCSSCLATTRTSAGSAFLGIERQVPPSFTLFEAREVESAQLDGAASETRVGRAVPDVRASAEKADSQPARRSPCPRAGLGLHRRPP